MIIYKVQSKHKDDKEFRGGSHYLTKKLANEEEIRCKTESIYHPEDVVARIVEVYITE